ncbi:MAG: ABC transporter permease [Promethearchaeota archaeon]
MNNSKPSPIRFLWARKILRDLWKFKGRTIPIILLIFLSTASGLVLMQIGDNLNIAQSKTVNDLNQGEIYINTFPVNASLAASTISQWKSDQPVIHDVQQRIFIQGQAKLDDGRKIDVDVIGLPSDERAVVNDIRVIDDTYFTDYSQENGAFIDKTYLGAYGWEIGSKIEIGVDALYSGTAKNISLEILKGSVSPEYGFGYVEQMEDLLASMGDLISQMGIKYGANLFVRADYLQDQLFNGEEVYNQFCIKLKDPDQAADIVQLLKGDYDIESYVYSTELYPLWMRMYPVLYIGIAWVTALFILFIASLVIYMVTHRFVEEQRGQIAVIKSLGYTRREVLKMYLNYGIIITFLGTIPGVIIGELLSFPVSDWFYSIMLFAYNPKSITWIYPIAIVLVTLGIILATSFSAARRAASVLPQEALRSQIFLIAGAEPLFEKILRRIFKVRLSPVNKFQLRALFSRPKRTMFTLVGIILSVTLVGMAITDVTAITRMGEGTFSDVNWDGQVILSDFREWNEVKSSIDNAFSSAGTDYEKIEPFLIDFCSIHNSETDVWEDFVFTGYLENTTLKSFNGVSGFTSASSVLLSEDLANNLGLSQGSDIDIRGRNQTTLSLTVQAVLEDSTLSVYFPLSTAMRLSFGDQPQLKVNGVMIEGSDVDSVRRKLEEISYVKTFIVREDLVIAVNELFGIIIPAVGAIAVLALFIGGALILSLMTINIGERRNDIITFRALGVTNKEIVLSLLTETIILGTIGAVIGYILGWISGNIYVENMSGFLGTGGIIASSPFSVIEMIAVGAVAFLEVFIAQFGALRSVLRETIAHVTREKIIG